MGSTGHGWSYKAWCSAVVGWFSTALIGTFRSSLFHSVICSLGGPLSHGSPVVVFFDRGHPRIWNFYSTIPVDVARVKSYMNCLSDPTCVVMRVTINKLYFVPGWYGGCLSTGESDVSVMLLNSVFHWSSSLSDVNFAAFTGNPLDYVVFFSRLDSVFWSY